MVRHSKIKKLLIANRGEIARRIHRACAALGIESVLVVSEPDSASLGASEVGQVVALGGATARDSYLSASKVIAAAVATGCDAVHPGYGFLSEDPDFAQAVLDAGLTFVGPAPASIRALGVKTTARATVIAAGVPVTPGSAGGLSNSELAEAAAGIGLPVIIKAAAGGGGRGMRIVREPSELEPSLERARAEALKNFGSDAVYLEKYIEEPRHVEVQLFGDMHGTVVHFGTRDCSSQRRHQKLLEEAPAPFLDPETRERIHQAAVAAAKSVGYYNAGTAEFLVRGSEFYFLEINTRIQVEHPVTEAVTGVDLVQLQLQVAMGERLPFSQEEIRFSGHAIELRINAEDVTDGFRPAVGTITAWERPDAPHIREDSGYRVGDTIPPFYDSLISKVIVHAPTRTEAIYTAFQFLRGYRIDGVPTTAPFHAWILANPEFQGDGIDIGYVERYFTKEGAASAAALLARDPLHRESSPSGEPYREVIDVRDVKEGEQPHDAVSAAPTGAASIALTHEPGGTFLAVPLAADGTPLDRSQWRRSNTRRMALASLTTTFLALLLRFAASFEALWTF
jgi:acetyl-CoA carboxylase biotin carboxylase subunit